MGDHDDDARVVDEFAGRVVDDAPDRVVIKNSGEWHSAHRCFTISYCR